MPAGKINRRRGEFVAINQFFYFFFNDDGESLPIAESLNSGPAL